MKRSIKYIIIFSTLFTLSFFCFKGIYNVKADSGWDSDYDFGSSWDSGSDWGSSWDSDYDSGSSWDSDSDYRSSGGSYHSSGSSSGAGFVAVIALLFWFTIIISIALSTDNDKSTSNSVYKSVIDNYKEITLEEANNIIKNFNIKEFNFKAYKTFYDVQIAWMEFDYDKLKELLTDELYNSYVMDLEVLESKNQKNIMKGFELIDTKLIYLNKQNDKYIARVVLEVMFYDYIEDSRNHKVLRGSDIRKLDNTYILTFERTKEETKENVCPQCGAPVKGNTTGICEYCKSKLINDNYDWVMSKKEKIDQR